MSKPERINLPGIKGLRCQLGTHRTVLVPDAGSLPPEAKRIVRAWSTALFKGAQFAIDYVDGTSHICSRWGEVGQLFDLVKLSKKSKGKPIEPTNVVAVVDAREPVEAAPEAPRAKLRAFMGAHCDKYTSKSPCSGGEVLERACGCGKTYRRCGAHGGLDGATRSVRSHWTLTGHDWRTGKFPVEAAPVAHDTPQEERTTRLRRTTPQILPVSIDGPAYLDTFGVVLPRLDELPRPAAPTPATEVAKTTAAPKAPPAWVAMMRFRAAPRVVARIPGRTV